MNQLFSKLLFVLLIASPVASHAEIVERQFRVPVTVALEGQPRFSHDVIVTAFQDNQRKPSRFMIILHGRAGTAAERAAYGRSRFVDVAQEFAAQGYAVFVPTRIGYGDTGGPDIEETGRCNAKDYVGGMVPATDEVIQLIAAIRKLPDMGQSAGVIVGQSVGGLLATSLAARKPPRVIAYVNFAGGAGGDPKKKPGQPCEPAKLTSAFAQFGAKARTPSLWLYSSNDLYWGPDYPREWFAAYRKAGGRVRFVALPPYGTDGHQSFSRNRDGWRDAVMQFLRNPQ